MFFARGQVDDLAGVENFPGFPRDVVGDIDVKS